RVRGVPDGAAGEQAAPPGAAGAGRDTGRRAAAARDPRLPCEKIGGMRKLWLLFAQAVTFTLAAIFVVSLVKPDWLAWRTQVVEVREAAPAGPVLSQAGGAARFSFSEAARKATPSVVNISATRQVRRRNPLLDDPAFQRFFGDR